MLTKHTSVKDAAMYERMGLSYIDPDGAAQPGQSGRPRRRSYADFGAIPRGSTSRRSSTIASARARSSGSGPYAGRSRARRRAGARPGGRRPTRGDRSSEAQSRDVGPEIRVVKKAAAGGRGRRPGRSGRSAARPSIEPRAILSQLLLRQPSLSLAQLAQAARLPKPSPTASSPRSSPRARPPGEDGRYGARLSSLRARIDRAKAASCWRRSPPISWAASRRDGETRAAHAGGLGRRARS